MTAYSTVLQRKCLSVKENLGCLLVRKVRYLPSSISTSLKRRKCSVDTHTGRATLTADSPQLLLLWLTSHFLVGGIRGSKRQHLKQPVPWALSSVEPTSPCAQRRCLYKKLAIVKWQVPCALWLQPHWESQIAHAFFSCTSYTKPHQSLLRSWCQASSVFCSMIMKRVTTEREGMFKYT